MPSKRKCPRHHVARPKQRHHPAHGVYTGQRRNCYFRLELQPEHHLEGRAGQNHFLPFQSVFHRQRARLPLHTSDLLAVYLMRFSEPQSTIKKTLRSSRLAATERRFYKRAKQWTSNQRRHASPHLEIVTRFRGRFQPRDGLVSAAYRLQSSIITKAGLPSLYCCILANPCPQSMLPPAFTLPKEPSPIRSSTWYCENIVR